MHFLNQNALKKIRLGTWFMSRKILFGILSRPLVWIDMVLNFILREKKMYTHIHTHICIYINFREQYMTCSG